MNIAWRSNILIRLVVILLIILAISMLFSYLFFNIRKFFPVKEEDRFFTIEMSITYENKPSGTEVWSLTDDDRAIGLFMNNSWQTVYLANSSFPIEKTEEDNDGNSVAYLSLPKAEISPGENLSYQVVYKVVLKPRSTPEISENISKTLDSISEGLKNQYCAMEGPWQVNNSMLRELAYEIVGDETNVLTIVKEIILWIDENVDDRTLEIPRYPNETYHEKAGDCDDQANLLITLLPHNWDTSLSPARMHLLAQLQRKQHFMEQPLIH